MQINSGLSLSYFLLNLVSVCLCGLVPESSKETYNLHSKQQFPQNSQNLADEVDNKFWLDGGKTFALNQASKNLNKNIAKNVIFFIGDGMSLATIAATRMYLGGEEKKLSFEQFPYTGLVRTYCVDNKVPDSASTATAYLTGVKANYGTIGVNAQVTRGDCFSNLDTSKHTQSIAKWAIDSGKAAGLVTTTRVTHASPAGVYAHTADRTWEYDTKVDEGCPANIDIAHQLVHGDIGSKLKVILGGGRKSFRDKSVKDEDGKKGGRSDGRDLIEEWLDAGKNRKYVYNRKKLLNVNTEKVDSLLGLFQSTHMLYHLEAEAEGLAEKKPTLAEMTTKAIEVLQKNKKGFFLFVEGGKIDIAHHGVKAKIALDEAAELSKAVEATLNLTSNEDTLIVVSSDHSHTMSFSGYPTRHNDIFEASEVSDKDNVPYMTLNYANGIAYEEFMDVATNRRRNPKDILRDSDYAAEFPSTLPLESETHGGEDVAVFANGPWSHLFTGSYEQNVLPHLMAYAACIGEGIKACN